MQPPFLDYDLPPHLIAQQPSAQRDQSRLMVIRRDEKSIEHHSFRDFPSLLKANDLLVLNDTRVLQARLLGQRKDTGGKWEGLFLRSLDGGAWELMCQTRGRLSPGVTIAVEPGPLELRLFERRDDGHWLVQPSLPGTPAELLSKHGHVPLPPYVRKGIAEDEDTARYQTVYAQRDGAVAAPTAGLHFTDEIFNELEACSIGRAFITLHVGPGTFQPIQTNDIARHRMHSEWCELKAATVDSIRKCREVGGRLVAVGTTSVRVLESAAASGTLQPHSAETELFIFPPYEWRCVDVLLTNFHLPRSTLLLLVQAFGGVDLIREAYRVAVAEKYRFFSYGDAMLII